MSEKRRLLASAPLKSPAAPRDGEDEASPKPPEPPALPANPKGSLYDHRFFPPPLPPFPPTPTGNPKGSLYDRGPIEPERLGLLARLARALGFRRRG
jgi:hypothetical protein